MRINIDRHKKGFIGFIPLIVVGIIIYFVFFHSPTAPTKKYLAGGCKDCKENSNNIYVLETSDNLIEFNNSLQIITDEFYNKYPDNYDFLTIFPTFPISGTLGDTVANATSMKNDVKGICKPIEDKCFWQYCSFNKLLGINKFIYNDDSSYDLWGDAKEIATTTMHETAHHWSTSMGLNITDRLTSNGVNGSCYNSDLPLKDGYTEHWSKGLDMPGDNVDVLDSATHWTNMGGGYYESSLLKKPKFHPFDLYLMGLMGKEEFKSDFTLLTDIKDYGGALPNSQITPAGDYAVTAKETKVSINDILKIAGEDRQPLAKDSQKDFRMAFLILVRPGQSVPEKLQKNVEDAAKLLPTEWSYATDGKSTMNK
ncbi:MAG: hypothetical protein NTY30_03080 [Candidatus Berkelbacteria bacterium]|nr:hypothetical protein [Candidatus Berkelbacteria bacterium]